MLLKEINRNGPSEEAGKMIHHRKHFPRMQEALSFAFNGIAASDVQRAVCNLKCTSRLKKIK